jgi:drug/metabolite transporter (DMT)-like permease
VLLLLVAGWYLCAIACITSSKRSLQACPFPCLLSLAQFSVSCGALWVLRLSGLAAVVQQSAATGRSLDKEEKVLLGRLVVAVGLSYCAGFLFTNLSFSLISANFAETIKSGEPITSVLLGYIVLKQSYTPFSYGCLTLICFGVGLSCVGVDEFSIWGFLAAGVLIVHTGVEVT